MNDAGALLTIAEVAATFAGFAALVTLFGRRRVAASAVHDLLRLRLVIGMSVVALLAALIPVALDGYGLGAQLTWRIGAVVFILLIVFVIASFVASYNSVKGSFPPDRLALSIALVLGFFVLAGLIAIASGLADNRSYGFYVSALIGTLAQAAFVFLRLVESTFSGIVAAPE
jgi:hypothetical protein